MFKKITIITVLIIVPFSIYLISIYFIKLPTSQPSSPVPNPTPTFFVPISKTPPIDYQLKLQTEGDKKFSDWQKDINKNYPWYNNFPLQEDNYFVYFDLDEKKFVGKIYPKKDTATSINQQVDAYKKVILFQLKKLGIDTTIYQFNWVVTPE
ncbi:MAG: hypothetical protein HYV37_00185 [Candidatus Levyibacteriota bacterium]|nr:MAG: hypothetical protein HYV37_00185 [Candidatus Levybacteria bacterium]